MAETVTFTGMVLIASPMKEYDKRIEVLTKERGRISAFARGDAIDRKRCKKAKQRPLGMYGSVYVWKIHVL